MKTHFTLSFVVVALLVNSTLMAQVPSAPPEMDIFKQEVGEWDAEIKAWSGPGEPEVTKGSETNRMMGGFWTIGNFKGKMFGFDFLGHGTYTFDAEKKKYVGTWRDSLGPAVMRTTGDYDKEKKTLTMTGDALTPEGVMAPHIMTTVFNGDKKVMTMEIQQKDGSKFKMLEISYTKKSAKKE